MQGYPFSKACIKLATQNMVNQVSKKYGIRFNCLAPNYVWVPKQEKVWDMYREHFEATTPMPYVGMPEDAAWAVVYLCSDEAKYINGVCLPVDGVCDIAVIGRGLLADPDLPNKVLAGRPDTIRPCISCNEGCIARVYNGETATCALNPRCGHEDGSIDIPPAAHPKKILVVGAGPAGCMAALYAKQAGHSVEIWEAGGHIGGNALCACKPFFKRDMHRMIRYFERELLVHDIPVRFYTTATPELAAAYAPDHILWAAGGRPIAPKAIPGLDCPKVYLATEALCDCCDVGERVVVIGGGLVGVETALQMDMWGKHVTCIDMAKTIPSEPGFKMNDMLMRDYMARSNVDFRPATKLVRIDGDAFTCSVTVEHAHEQQQIACDTVLLALGFAPTAQAAAAFEAVAPVTVLGDAQQPRKILFAVGDAHEAVRKLSD